MKTKRLLAMLLTAAMLISLLPATVVFAAGENDVVLDFDALPGAGLQGNQNVLTAEALAGKGFPFSIEHNGLTIGWSNVATNNVLRCTVASGRLWPHSPAKRVATFKFSVPTDGYYSVNVKGSLSQWSARAAVIIDAEFNANGNRIVSGQYVGGYDFTTDDTSTNASVSVPGEEKTLNTVYLTEGDHTIMFLHSESPSGRAEIYLFFNKVSFNYVGEEAPTPKEIETNLAEKVSKGKNETFSATVKMSDGSPLHIEEYEHADSSGKVAASDSYLSVTSLTPTILEVTSCENAGLIASGSTTYTIKGKAPGTATLKYTLFIDGAEVTGASWTKEVVVEDSNDVLIDFNELAEGANMAALNTNASTQGFPYAFNGTAGIGNWRKQTAASGNVLRNELGVGTSPWPTSKAASRKAAIDVTVPADGYYSISFKGGVSTFGCDSSIYIADKYVGDYSFYANNTQARGKSEPGEEKTLNTVYLTAGTNTITFNARNEYPDAEDYPNVYMFFHTLTLDYLEDVNAAASPAVTAAELETKLPAKAMPVGNSLGFTASVTMSDGSSLYLGDYLSDGTEDTENYLSITSEDAGVVEVSAVTKGGYQNSEIVSYTLTANGPGKTNLVYTLYFGGEKAGEWKKPVEATDVFDVIADFSTCSVGIYNHATAPMKLPEGASFDFNTSLGAQEWRNNNTQGNVVRATLTRDVWPEKTHQWTAGAIDMEVSRSGYYSVRFKGGLSAVSAKTSIFVGDKYVGDYDFTSSDATTGNAVNSHDGEEKTMNTVWLEEGTNTFIFRSRSAHNVSAFPNNTYQFFKKLSLIYVKEAPTAAELETGLPEEITKGIAATSAATVKMSDGSSLSLGDYNADGSVNSGDYLTVTSSTPEVLDVRNCAKGGLCNAETTSYKLIPMKAGEATLTYTLYIGGNVAKTWQETVSVSENGSADDVIIDFNTCIAGEDGPTPIDGAPYSFNTTDGSGEWKNDTTANNTVRAALDKAELWPANSGKDGAAAIDVTVPKNGYYSVRFQGGLSMLGGKASIYAGEEYVGDYDFTSEDEKTNDGLTSIEGEEKTLNTVYLKEGTNTFMFRLASSHEAEEENAFLFFNKLSLIYVGAEAPTAAEISASLPSAGGGVAGMLSAEVKTQNASIKMSDGSQLYIGEYLSNGAADTENRLEVTSDKPDIIEVTEVKKGGLCNSENTSYTLTAKSIGTANITFTLYLKGAKAGEWTEQVSSLPEMQKTEPTIYTYEMRENAKENIAKYPWAKTLRDNAVKSADEYIVNLDAIYDMIIGEGLPRSMTAAMYDDPNAYDCVYCGKDLRDEYNSYAWGIDPLNRPWKMQCVYCKRVFPSNDFGSLFKLGHIPEGYYNKAHDTMEYYDRVLALENHRQMLLDKGIALPSLEMTDERRAQIRDTGDLLTKEEQAYFGFGVKGGYLYNDAYQEVGETLKVPADEVNTWAVDDGWGWDTGKRASSGVPIRKGFVAFYGFSIWSHGSPNRFITKAIDVIRDAYLYTGDMKYGRAGAILIDRVADVYPSYDWSIHFDWQSSNGGTFNGKIDGNQWERQLSHGLIAAYDAFWPAMDDEQVIAYLSAKAEELGLDNKKLTGDMIRRNCEDGICREVFEAVKTCRINSNTPNLQSNLIFAAIGLNSMPETQEMFDYCNLPGNPKSPSVVKWGKTFWIWNERSGALLMPDYVDIVDRDGFPNQVSELYNQGKLTQTIELAEMIRVYEELTGYDTGLDFYDSPKFRNMFYSTFNMTMAGNYTIQLGDQYGTAGIKNSTNANSLLYGMTRLGDMSFAQRYWAVTGGDMSRAYISIFEKDADYGDVITDYVREHGEMTLPSQNLAGYGLATLRDGEKIKSTNASAEKDYRRDTWLWYGLSTESHAHIDTLQMGIDAYGFNFTPDLGYPAATGYDPNRLQWVANTLSHNTVVVDGKRQDPIRIGTPLHFDDNGKIGVIDVEAPNAYKATDIYRRTLVSVEASSEVAYTVDFFRIKGGNEHVYSFHTQSFNGVTVDGLELTPQVDESGSYVGSYAGADVDYGKDPDTQNTTFYETRYPRGYTWLRNVRRDESPDNAQFSVNFKQTDFNKQVKDSSGLNLKWTALNDWTPTSVGFATAETPNVTHNKNIPELDYMLVHRKDESKQLDTLFTSVIQPYNGTEYIASMASVPVLLGETAVADNSAKAVRVTLKSGRTDYIVYSLDNTKTYTISDTLTSAAGEEIPVSFGFSGFVGVYSVNESGANIYSYVNDGTLIGDTAAKASITGEVVDFTKELANENSITVKLDGEAAAEELVGRYIYVDNDGSDQNGAYRIEGVSTQGGNTVLDVGTQTHVTKYRDATNVDLGFLYNIAEGDSFVIPLSAAGDSAPTITSEIQDDLTTSAGSSISVTVSADSPAEEKITYVGTVMPRGASINAETGVVTWRPDASQVGEHGFLITAVDESGRETTITFEVTVYGSTTGSTSTGGTTTTTPDNSGTGTSSGTGTTGGGGGGGGGGSSGQGSTDSSTDDNTGNTDDGETPSVGDADSSLGEGASGDDAASGNVRFIDLGNHAWAADSINSLADDGVIKGTSATTYSPANNITRADYAILLVRAFGLESDDTTNFADVSASDYFAAELAVARNTGIVNGIGDNKYAPRNTITRQDMMVIIYRALEKLGKIDETNAETNGDTANPVGRGLAPAEYPDYNEVADYAKDAVSYLISNGLVNGKNGRIAPTDYTTRAEVAVLLKRILEYVQ